MDSVNVWIELTVGMMIALTVIEENEFGAVINLALE